MARIVVIGSVARDDVVRLHEGFREGTHLQGAWHGPRLGGGASCTAVPLAHAGHDVVVVGSIGLDDLGEELLAELEATGVDMSQVARIDQPSTRSIILVDGEGERTVINVTRTHQDEPPARLLRLGADCVYVRSRRLDLAPLLREKAGSSLIIAHLPPCMPQGVRPAHILVASASDVDADVLDDPLEVGRRVAGDLLQWVLVTYGAKGVIAYGQDETLKVSAPKVKPVDTTGAGDTFAAGLVHALVTGKTMTEALETGVVWGAEATQWESSILPAEAVERLLQ
jgi:sugar/nucleoside kinase (ribokinase family)